VTIRIGVFASITMESLLTRTQKAANSSDAGVRKTSAAWKMPKPDHWESAFDKIIKGTTSA
jgi:hypothetical protein